MPDLTLTWNTVTGASGYRIHAGLQPTVYTHVSDDIPADSPQGATKSGTISLPTADVWYAAVAAYDVNGYEGLYSTEGSYSVGLAPVGTITLNVR